MSEEDQSEKQQHEDNAQKYIDHLLKNGNIPAEDTEMQLPPWFDEKLCKKAQSYFFQYLFGIFGFLLVGLISVLAIPSIIGVLACTKQSSSAAMAYRRYFQTIFHVVTWHEYDLKPGTKNWQSLEIVRKKHSKASRICEKTKAGLIVTQRDLAITQFAFMGFTVLYSDFVPEQYHKEYCKATIHFWRVIGHILGIRDEFNLCTDSLEGTKARLLLVRDQIYKPALENVDKQFEDMTKCLIDGLWCYVPSINYEETIFITKWMSRCEGYQYKQEDMEEWPPQEGTSLKYKELPLMQRISLAITFFMVDVLYKNTIFRVMINVRVLLSHLCAYYLPVLGAYKFGLKWAYVRIFNEKDEAKQHGD